MGQWPHDCTPDVGQARLDHPTRGDGMPSEFHGSAAVLLDASPDEVFAALTDVERLAEWNAKVHHVVEGAPGPLAEDSEWVIEMRAMGTRWPSRARATTVDAAAGRFE